MHLLNSIFLFKNLKNFTTIQIFNYQIVYGPYFRLRNSLLKGMAKWYKSCFLLHHNSVGLKGTELCFFLMILLDGKQKFSNCQIRHIKI